MASSSMQVDDDVIETAWKAYRTVVGRNIPASLRDQDNRLLLWTRIYSPLGVHGDVAEELRKILPCLPDLTWQNAAPVLGLGPSRGGEQLSGYPLQTLYLPTSFVRELLRSVWRSASYRNGQRHYALFGSCADSSMTQKRMVHDAALLILESERWSDQTKVRAQAIAEATFVYSFPIHIVITDLCETTLYTYNPSAKKFYKRAHFKIEEFRVEPDPDIAASRNGLCFGTGIVLFDGGRISRFHPSNDTPFSLALNFATEFHGTIVQSTGVNVKHALHVKAICHSLLSFIGFETGSDVDDKSRSIFYHIPKYLDLKFELRVEAIPHTESDTSYMTVTLQWRQQKADWKLGGSWSLCFETFFCTDVALPSNFDEIEDSGFQEFDAGRAITTPVGQHTEALKRSLSLIEEAKTLLSNPLGAPEEEERGVEKLRESVRLLPWESRFFSDEEIRARVEDVQRLLSYVSR
ncbi:uncharacterized protein ARMOST_22235 [Armillaria ostoyae]|uniref:Uncharacterized protein n=1 Tax=Armillaria ostoyae TaxID=47428 RepID=A0A284SC96_ARMOS|nr:uncharacterized protein ARMOST_22235 [Armillaria ostoyae]